MARSTPESFVTAVNDSLVPDEKAMFEKPSRGQTPLPDDGSICRVPRYSQIVVSGYGNGLDEMSIKNDANLISSDPSDRPMMPHRMSNLEAAESNGQKGPPKPVGFWDKGLSQVRKQAAVKWVRMTTILAVFILAVLSLYWGALFDVEKKMSCLHVYVVDFDSKVPPFSDTPLVGPAIVQATEEQHLKPGPRLGFRTRDAADFDFNPLEVRRAVYNFDAWAAIIINANATTLLRQSLRDGGNASYDPFGAAQIIFVEARDEPTIREYVYPSLMELQIQISSQFGRQWAREALNSTIPYATLDRVPQAINPAIGFSIFNLRPFMPAVSTPTVSIGLIYLIIIAFFSFMFFMPIHMEFVNAKTHPPLQFYQLIIWRWISTVSAYLIMSLCYSLVPFAFQIPFSNATAPPTDVVSNPNAFGHATFFIYWMLNFLGMIALGLACENVAMIVGQPWTALWLIFWVITNVCTSFYALDLAPRFYYWGYAWPLHNIVEASRQLLFDLHSRIWLNFFVLIAWCVINTIFFPFCCYFMRRKAMRAVMTGATQPQRQSAGSIVRDIQAQISAYVDSNVVKPARSHLRRR